MTPPALPEHLQDSLRIAWHISSWCNYSCPYCGVLVFHKRAKDKEARQAHAFDHAPVEKWLDVFRGFPQKRIYLKITGGEPFLDRANFLTLLEGLTAMERYTLRIDTNGTWDPSYFKGVDKRRILLNISFHPGEVEFAAYRKRLLAIRDAGFQVGMVNFVMSPENIDFTEETLNQMEKDGFFMNVSAMIATGIYTSRKERTRRELELIEGYNPAIDVHYRLVNPVTKGRLCFHPAFSYYMLYDGSIKVHCGGQLQNIFDAGAPELPRTAVPCPYEHCESCVEMYRSLVDEPLVTRPLSLYPLNEYVDEVLAHRRERRWKNVTQSWRRRVERVFLTGSQPNGNNGLVPVGEIQAAASDVVGSVDGIRVEARSRDRLLVSGWAASRTHGPVKEVRLRVGEQAIGVVKHFCARPEVAERLQRPDLAECGWQTMVYLPPLRPGTYQLVAQGVASDGAAADLDPLEVRIVE